MDVVASGRIVLCASSAAIRREMWAESGGFGSWPSGQDSELQVLIEGQRVFTPIRLDKGRNVGVYETRDKLVASGLVWDEARDQLAQKAYLVHEPVGRGHIIAFAEDPNYRAFTEAAELLFINAVILGPGY